MSLEFLPGACSSPEILEDYKRLTLYPSYPGVVDYMLYPQFERRYHHFCPPPNKLVVVQTFVD
jgi:hypothetical protein